MERKFSEKYRLLRTLTIIAVCFFCGVVCGCTSNAIPAGTPFPLTYENFQKVLNDEIHFVSMFIQYGYYDFPDDGQSSTVISLGLSANEDSFYLMPGRAETVAFSQIDTFNTLLSRRASGVADVDQTATSSDKVKLIFDYVKTHQYYFFSGEEFHDPDSMINLMKVICGTGYESGEPYIHGKNKHNFLISVRGPKDNGQEKMKWMILKSADEPNEAFQGLIDLLEKEFFAVDRGEHEKVSE